MLAYLREIWKCRFFWLSLVHMDLRTRYRGSVIGMGWSLLHPICMTIILCLVFAKLMGMPLHDFAPYLMTGLAFWSFLQIVTVQGCFSFFHGQAYIRQFPAPMAIYPLRCALGAAFHFTLALSLVIVLAWVLRGLPSPMALLALLPAWVMLVAFGWSLALLFGLATVRFRDTHHLAEIGLQGLFYLTPIFYPAEVLTSRGLGWLLQFNPLMPFLSLLRTPILDGQWPVVSVWAAASGVLLVTGTAAALAMRQEERQLIFHL
jgi:ABC-type polysaccharide/polyol phosphate export permease